MGELEGETSRALRADGPGETRLAIWGPTRHVEVSRMRYSVTTPDCYAITKRVVENVRVYCPTSLRLASMPHHGGRRGTPSPSPAARIILRNVGEDGELFKD